MMQKGWQTPFLLYQPSPKRLSVKDIIAMTQFATAPDGINIAFEIDGSGPPIVLLHGFTNSSQSWRALGFTDLLVKAGRQVILVDARGHGKSHKPHESGSYTDIKRAADVVAVLDALGLRSADLCGYSMGGWTAIAVASFYSQRCRSLTCIGAHGFDQSLSLFRGVLEHSLDDWICHIEAVSGRRARPILRNQILANDLHALRASVAFDRTDLSRNVADAACPSLLICGDRDPLSPEIARFGRTISAWTVTLPGRNHFTTLAATHEIASALLPFLGFVDKGSFDPALLGGSQKRLMPNTLTVTGTEPVGIQAA